ncbi:MAG: methionyl-tRNA formyltransferase [Mucinivorans sp.]
MRKTQLRIIYMGTPDFAVGPLTAMIEGGYNVVAVVTVPDRPAGRGQQLHPSAVKAYIEEHNRRRPSFGGVQVPEIPILQPEKLKDPDWLDDLSSFNADLFVVVAFRMLPEAVFAMPKYGTFNLHASLLPDYKGAAPINWAIINGEKQTGVTTFFIDRQIDSGEIIEQRSVEISDDDNVGSLHDKLKTTGSELVIETINQIINGTITSQPQQESASDKPAPKIFKEDCKIDWNASGRDICNKIRGLSPYPAAWADLTDRLTAKILTSHFVPDFTAPKAGKLATDEIKYLKFSCKDGWVFIDTIHPAGKKAMDIEDFLRGYDFD